MKTSVLLLSISFLMLIGCSNENVDILKEPGTGELVYIFNNNSENPTWETRFLEDAQLTKSNSNILTNNAKMGNSAHTHGNIDGGSLTFNWSGIENNGGSHGSAVITQDFGPFVVTIKMETSCISILNNEAVYGGTITEVLNDPFNGSGPYALGNTLFFKVTDNGQGRNATADQYVQAIVTSTLDGCDSFSPNSSFWNLPFISVADVESTDMVKVNN
ncbi:hypothetical protein [Lacinutrix himadriensis]|uniref:hypothetical protein n=1 Tax=Lacinutrix himadriensis TaxID=641549 RepID=UPI0006E16948|nr:hypothetical protein [Lacinutrix himadriensis]